MDKFTIEIELGDDAMLEGADIAAALTKVAHMLASFAAPNTSGSIRDANGNRVGEWRFE